MHAVFTAIFFLGARLNCTHAAARSSEAIDEGVTTKHSRRELRGIVAKKNFARRPSTQSTVRAQVSTEHCLAPPIGCSAVLDSPLRSKARKLRAEACEPRPRAESRNLGLTAYEVDTTLEIPMRGFRLAAVFVVLCLPNAPAARAADDLESTLDGATIFRVFLKDGTSLLSYGELARVDNRVVFSMPTSTSIANPPLHLVNIAADHVDWERTNRYAESVRSTHYLATMADHHYAMLTVEIGQTLNDLSLTTDPARHLEIVERARKVLADWPAAHFNYKQAEISQMLATIDEAIAELRARAGVERFDLSFVASSQTLHGAGAVAPAATPQGAIEQCWRRRGLSRLAVRAGIAMAVAWQHRARRGRLAGDWRRSPEGGPGRASWPSLKPIHLPDIDGPGAAAGHSARARRRRSRHRTPAHPGSVARPRARNKKARGGRFARRVGRGRARCRAAAAARARPVAPAARGFSALSSVDRHAGQAARRPETRDRGIKACRMRRHPGIDRALRRVLRTMSRSCPRGFRAP